MSLEVNVHFVLRVLYKFSALFFFLYIYKTTCLHQAPRAFKEYPVTAGLLSLIMHFVICSEMSPLKVGEKHDFWWLRAGLFASENIRSADEC